mmetsp:Transcript_36394/g.113249  ORF Transcript_36394/g.113249 Transcript_36394/m.113249 type:complete len:84 (-) Transcript_36394:215-466(-)
MGSASLPALPTALSPSASEPSPSWSSRFIVLKSEESDCERSERAEEELVDGGADLDLLIPSAGTGTTTCRKVDLVAHGKPHIS